MDKDYDQPKIIVTTGLTKREYFAGLALQGLISSNSGQTYEYLVTRSIKAADELLKQLEIKK